MGWIEETHRVRKPVRGVAYDARAARRDSTKSFATEREARDWITFREEQIANLYRDAGGEYRHRRQAPRLADYARSRVSLVPEWRTKGTRRQRANVIETEVRHYFGESIRVDEVSKTHIYEMLSVARDRALTHGRSGASGAQDKIATFRRIFDFAIDEGWRADNPTRGVQAPRMSRKAKRPMPDKEIHDIAALMPDSLRAAVWVSADAGLRIGEVCGLQRRDVNLDKGTIRVKHVIDDDGELRDFPKGMDVLTVSLPDRLHAELTRHIEKHYEPNQDKNTKEYVFTLPDGKGLREDGLRLRFYRAYAEMGGDPHHQPVWHDLRHNTAKRLADTHTPIWVIQAILRHKNIATTQGYLPTVSEDDQRQWANRAFDGQEYSGA